jgi:hypothetical protein
MEADSVAWTGERCLSASIRSLDGHDGRAQPAPRASAGVSLDVVLGPDDLVGSG